jgi:hypothetical protein
VAYERLPTQCPECGRRFEQFKIHELALDEENHFLCADCDVPLYLGPSNPDKDPELLAWKERQELL